MQMQIPINSATHEVKAVNKHDLHPQILNLLVIKEGL